MRGIELRLTEMEALITKSLVIFEIKYIWWDDILNRALLIFSNDFKINEIWNSLSNVQKAVIGIIFLNSLVCIGWRLPNVQPILAKYFLLLPTSGMIKFFDDRFDRLVILRYYMFLKGDIHKWFWPLLVIFNRFTYSLTCSRCIVCRVF